MKKITITFSILIILLLSSFLGNTQTEVTPTDNLQSKITAERVELNEYSQISEKFSTPDVYRIDTRSVVAALQSPNFDSQLKIQFGTKHNWDLELYPIELRSPDYKLRVVTANGIEERQDTEIKTYYGYLKGRPDTEVRLTITDDFLYGFVEDGENTVYFEPANRFQPSFNQGEVILYRPDQVTEKTGTCAHTEKKDKSTPSANPAPSLTPAGDCFELDLAIASDYSYYVDRGSNVAAVTAYTLGVMNNVASNYELSGSTNFADGIEFLIVENFVVTTSNGDPWTTSTDPFVLLPNFRAWARGATGFSATHDLGQLWTNRDFNGSTIGLAYTSVDVICSGSRYHILEDYPTASAALLRVLTAHEIGHNFGAEHDGSGSGFIMAPSVNLTSDWSQASKDSANIAIINASTGAGACLTSCSTGPPNSDFTTSSTVGCAGSTIRFFDNSTNGTSSWNWSFPGGTPSSSTLQNPTVTYSGMGSYDVTLTASNGSGTGTTETKVEFINIIQSPPTACVPGGNLGNGGISFFSLGNISNSSGSAIEDGNTYQDLSCLQNTDLEPGTTYSGIIAVGNANTNTLEALRIYIDYNNDGDFSDNGEFIISSGNQVFAGGLSFDYTAPAAPLVSGVILRMRVMANQTLSSPCQNMTTGQVEDYGIVFPGVAPLPVTLTSYTASPRNQTSLLDWTTESEYNNDFYTLEYSTNGRDFEILDEINGKGTTAETSSYQYIHKNPIIGENYYRLTQIDFDGTQEVLGTKVLTFKTDEIIVKIQPNPILEQSLRIAYISPENGMVEMTVLGVDGKIIREKRENVLAGTTMIDLELPGLSNGIYFLKTVQGNIVKTSRFMKTN